jgi:hypothetical protein
MPMFDQCLKEKGRNSAGHAAKKHDNQKISNKEQD